MVKNAFSLGFGEGAEQKSKLIAGERRKNTKKAAGK